MIHKYILCLSLIINFGECWGQKLCDQMYEIVFIDTKGRDVDAEILYLGKDAIPCLIELIDVDRKTAVGYLDPRSSTIHSFVFDNYVGIRAAYLIELILSQGNIKDNGNKKSNIGSINLYKYMVIVKLRNSEPILEPLKYNDMKVIKGFYLKWWRLNKSKSIELLREEWRENNNSILGNHFKWI